MPVPIYVLLAWTFFHVWTHFVFPVQGNILAKKVARKTTLAKDNVCDYTINMKKRSAINLSKAVFKGRAYFSFFSLVLAAVTLTMVISVFLPGGPDRTFFYVLFLVGIPALYLMIALAYYKFWLLDDRIVLKYPFRFRNRYRTMLLSDVDHLVYKNKLSQSELTSMVIIQGKPNASWKNYELGFNDRKNKNVFVFLHIMYTRGFEIDISTCVRESLVEDQIALGIRNDEKLMYVHY